MLRLAMLAGPRQSEIRALAWSTVDFGSREIRICQRADRWNNIGAPKSAAGTRTIPIGPALASALKAWKLRCPPNPLNLVFPGRAGAVLKQHTMAAKFLRLEIAAGLAIETGKRDADGDPVWSARYGWHDLRHAAASAWIAQGVDLKRLQVWIGHENIQLTLDTYGHLIRDAKKDAELASGSEAALLA
jgi:integrase